MYVLEETYKHKVVLTGITGFLGSRLAKVLIDNGYEVIGLKRTTSSLHRLNEIRSCIKLYDIDDMSFVELFDTIGDVHCIIHTATCYGRAKESVNEIFQANAAFPLALLDAGVKSGITRFINTDTVLDKYLNLYSLSKNQFLQWGVFFSSAEKINFINLKLEHFFGPNDDESKFTSYVINSCLSNKLNLNLTFGEQTRDFIYIDDVTAAFLAVLKGIDEFESAFTELEVGSGNDISIRKFVEYVHSYSNSTTSLNFGAIPYRKGEVMSSKANIDTLKQLGWSCKYDIEAAIRETIDKEKSFL